MFISCPSDINQELDSINHIISEVNRTYGKQSNFNIQLVNWKDDTYGQRGSEVQEVINSQVEYDILVALMWLKAGTATKKYDSGTIEEIHIALDNDHAEQFVFFNLCPPDNINDIIPEELAKINKFKKHLGIIGFLYKEYSSIQEFESLFRLNLSNLIADRYLTNETQKKNHEVSTSSEKNLVDDPYAHIEDLISEIENDDDISTGFDVFTLGEEISSSAESLTSVMNAFAVITNELNERLERRTVELNALSIIKDDRLRLKKGRTISDLLAKELDEYRLKMEAELPLYSSNIMEVANSYSKLLLASNAYDDGDIDELKDSLIGLRNNMVDGVNNTSEFIKAFINWPPASKNLNVSKRETIVTMKEILKKMLEGVKIMDGALENNGV